MSTSETRESYRANAPVALVVGCGDLGMGCARHLGLQHPLLLLDVDAARLDREVDALRRQGFDASAHLCDITNVAQTHALSEALARGPGVRVLAHVAAVGPTIGDWRKMLAVNLLGPHLIVQAVRPHMVRGSAAVFVSSAGGYLVKADEARDRALDEPLAPDFFERLVRALGREPSLFDTYCYAKRALMRLARRLAANWGADQVRSLSISPGAILTTMGRRDGALSDARKDITSKIPLGREGTVDEIAATLAFLASDAASFVNGIDLLVDGGQRASALTRPRA